MKRGCIWKHLKEGHAGWRAKGSWGRRGLGFCSLELNEEEFEKFFVRVVSSEGRIES